jgi:hypothetical protein
MKPPELSPGMQDALSLISELTDKILARDREIEVLTRERDAALKRVKDLEWDLEWALPFVEIADTRERPDGP